MVDVSLNALVRKLDPLVHEALEQAAWLCRSMTHYDIELEHLLIKLAEKPESDLGRILEHFGADSSRLTSDVTEALEKLKRGNTRDTPGISPRIGELFQAAWMFASVERGAGRIRSGDILLVLLADSEFTFLVRELSRELRRVDTEELAEQFAQLTAGSAEGRDEGRPDAPGGAASGPARPASAGKLDLYTLDLTARAKAEEIDPVVGRESEVRQMVDILMRRRQNNPILTGEPGVGKTAVVEGLAVRIARGDVPEPLRRVTLRTLDLGLLQAGAGVRGEFEDRLKGIIDEVRSSPAPIILFIDEAHTLIGAGGSEGQSDAANLLKPALARGELRTIAATTWKEYKRYFEKDAALARRFQIVKVEEPDLAGATAMMRAIAPHMEAHHGVEILPDALAASVAMSARFLSDRQLPDKAVSVLDTACARIAVAQVATPAPLEDAARRIEDLENEQRILQREEGAGLDVAERLDAIAVSLAQLAEERDGLERRLHEEQEIAQRISSLRSKLAPDNGDAEVLGEAQRVELQAELSRAMAELGELQGETPLLSPFVDGRTVADVISGWTGIPAGRMLADEIRTVLDLHKRLGERVVGQDSALEAVARRIQTSRASLSDPGQPIGVFLMVGPSGVGKTETGLALAELLYGGERNLITINMSEYQEAHTVSALKGSPPGYVGYGEGGVLTEAVRRRPYSVVLLDEVEKAHPDVMELFYQVFDKGVLEDGEGRQIDFCNTVILLTSNLATDTIVRLCADEETLPDYSALAGEVRGEVIKHFKPALVGRLVLVPYLPLGSRVMRSIIGLKVEKIRARVREHHGIELEVPEAVMEAVHARCTASETGARNIDHILTDTMLPEISREILAGMAEGRQLEAFRVGVDGQGAFTYTSS